MDQPPTDRVDLRLWALLVLGWDGLLPVAIALTSLALQAVFRGQRRPIEFAAILLPVVAFLVRLLVGTSRIERNSCPPRLRAIQIAAFFLGILLLGLIECCLILIHILPRGALFAARSDQVVWALLASSYLVLMTIAMYPGRSSPHPAREYTPR